MVTINLKVSMCRDIIANSNITKEYVVIPCDSVGEAVRYQAKALVANSTLLAGLLIVLVLIL